MKYLALTFLIVLFLFCKAADATNLRGKVVRNQGGRLNPVVNCRVSIYFWNAQNRHWDFVSDAVTGADGFYYFINFSPGRTFCVAVLGKFYPPQPLQIAPPSRLPYQDITVIAI